MHVYGQIRANLHDHMEYVAEQLIYYINVTLHENNY
jgi:hypothetical protein